MYKYHFVAKAVEPKRIQLREAKAEKEQSMAKLETAQARLRDVQANIAKLERDFSHEVAKQTELQDDMKLCEVKLDRAHELIGGLEARKPAGVTT